MSSKPSNINDILVQACRPPKQDGRHVNLPIELGSTIVFDTMNAFENVETLKADILAVLPHLNSKD